MSACPPPKKGEGLLIICGSFRAKDALTGRLSLLGIFWIMAWKVAISDLTLNGKVQPCTALATRNLPQAPYGGLDKLC